MHGELKIWNWK